MAYPNRNLEAALSQFAAQLGTTRHQEAQLRTAIIADSDKLALFNQQATGEQLKRLALEATDSRPDLTGARANVTDVIAVPVVGFQPWGAALLLCSAIFRRIASLLLAAVIVIPAGCATSSETLEPAKEVAAMTASDTSSATESPSLSADEIGKRFLKLIEGLESREDLSFARIQDVVGVKLLPALRGEFYGVEGDLGGGWKYALNFYPEARSHIGVQLHFINATKRFGDMTPVCNLNFDRYHNALENMDYRDVPIYGEIGQLESRRYYKGGIMLLIIPQNAGESEADRVCVKSVHAELS